MAYAKLLDLPVQRRLVAMLDGWHYGQRAGSSQEFLDLAEYQVGDEIKNIDWKTTARYGEPVVKRFESTAQLQVVFAVDASGSMGALTKGQPAIEGHAVKAADLETKAQVLIHLATALSVLTMEHSDQLGMVIGGRDHIRTIPPRAGLSHAESMLRLVERIDVNGPRQDMAAVLRRVDVSLRNRSLVVVFTDPVGVISGAYRHLQRLAMRHQLMVFLIPDFDPTQMPLGRGISDVDLGPLPAFVRSDPKIAEAVAALREQQERQAVAHLEKLGAQWAMVSSKNSVLDALVEVLQGGRRGHS